MRTLLEVTLYASQLLRIIFYSCADSLAWPMNFFNLHLKLSIAFVSTPYLVSLFYSSITLYMKQFFPNSFVKLNRIQFVSSATRSYSFFISIITLFKSLSFIALANSISWFNLLAAFVSPRNVCCGFFSLSLLDLTYFLHFQSLQVDIIYLKVWICFTFTTSGWRNSSKHSLSLAMSSRKRFCMSCR